MSISNLFEHLPVKSFFEAAGKALDGEFAEAAETLTKGVIAKETGNYIKDKVSGSSNDVSNSTYDD